MQPTRFVMLGGFLGAGKTTALARLARHYMGQGQRVALVTNDQAQDLVDTYLLREQGFSVQEVAGACFCCRFDDLMARVEDLCEEERPDLILSEPVGSCTDLVATVIQPLRDLYGERFQVAPYVVLFKPSHGLRILSDKPAGGFSPKAAYIFRKQLEEADVVAINRADELSSHDADKITELLAAHFPGPVPLRISACTGQGFDALVEVLNQQGAFGRKILDIDYDIYAAGEAELGWLNSSVHLVATDAFDLDALLIGVIDKLGQTMRRLDAEVAHLKAIGLTDGGFGTANLISNQSKGELSLSSRVRASEADLIVNARVALDPSVLRDLVRAAVEELCKASNVNPEFRTMQSFRPGRPEPTHRYARAK
jgi:Ni2+-binding GTPase involved in maturation of urease and hydrogenase